ncbi:ATP-binding protein [Mangrovibacterium marinum]|uniref:sensor histidine kinase n=1 Tax=Mangrovibacterium marinum TaxID=1639118 RepID=UPI002A188FE7|nr:ATP-binding protein [Mangrovibacterium marinum]
MLLKVALLLAMLIQIGAAIIAVSLIRRTRFNGSWILISAGFVLMAIRRLFDFSTLFGDSPFFQKEEVNSWLGILISILIFVGVIYIREIFNLRDRIDELRKENESAVLSAVIQAEEKARQKFARDLHDGLGPVLSSIKMGISAIDLQSLDQQNKLIVQRSTSATDQAIVSLKEISNQLSPHLLKNFGLTTAIESFEEQLLGNSDIRFQFEATNGNDRFPYQVEITLYRIVSELINNSIKHGHPKLIQVSLSQQTDMLCLTYNENGQGFETDQLSKHQGMGLENIRSRVKSMKGIFQLESVPGKGIHVTIQVPTK